MASIQIIKLVLAASFIGSFGLAIFGEDLSTNFTIGFIALFVWAILHFFVEPHVKDDIEGAKEEGKYLNNK